MPCVGSRMGVVGGGGGGGGGVDCNVFVFGVHFTLQVCSVNERPAATRRHCRVL